MQQSALERAVARATGESRRTIRHYGFSLVPEEPPAVETASHLGLDCPGCGAAIALNSRSATLPELAECTRCDGLGFIMKQKSGLHRMLRPIALRRLEDAREHGEVQAG